MPFKVIVVDANLKFTYDLLLAINSKCDRMLAQFRRYDAFYHFNEWRYLRLEKIQNGGRPPSWKMSNGHMSATGHAIHFAFGSRVWFSGRQIECLYFRSRPSAVLYSLILNDHISETVHPIQFVFGSWVKV